MLKRILSALLSLAVAAYALFRFPSHLAFYGTTAAVFLLLAVLILLKPSSRWHILIHSGVAFIFLDLTFRKTDWHYLLQFFGSIDYRWVPAIALAAVLNIFLRAAKWSLLFPAGRARIAHLTEATAVGFMVNNIFPARAGEVVRAILVSRRSGLSKSSVLTTVFLERIMDGMALTFFFIFLILASPLDRSRFALYSTIAIALYTSFLLLTVLFYFFRPFFEKRALSLVTFFRPSAADKVRNLIARIHEGLHILRNGRTLLLFFVLTLLHWGFSQFIIWLCCRSVNLLPAFGITSVSWYFASLFLLILICFAISVPSGPGGAGPYQYIVQLALLIMSPAMAGNTALLSAAAGFSIYLWVVQSLPVILTGLIYYLKSGLSLKSLKNAGN